MRMMGRTQLGDKGCVCACQDKICHPINLRLKARGETICKLKEGLLLILRRWNLLLVKSRHLESSFSTHHSHPLHAHTYTDSTPHHHDDDNDKDIMFDVTGMELVVLIGAASIFLGKQTQCE